MSATYLVWHPRVSSIEDRYRIAFNVTVGSANPALAPTANTCREIITDLEWNVGDGDWTISPYRSNYHGELHAGSWKREWPRGWKAVMTSMVRPPSPPDGEYFETFAMGEPASNPKVHGLVIADFRSPAALELVVGELTKTHKIDRTANSESFRLFGEVVQLQIAVASANDANFESIVPVLRNAVALCRNSGAMTSFDERADTWGEAE